MTGVADTEESWGSSVLRPQAYQDVGAVTWIRRRPYREPWRAGTHAMLCSLAVCCLALASTQVSYTREVLIDVKPVPATDAWPDSQVQDLMWLVSSEEDEWLEVRSGDPAAIVSPEAAQLSLGSIVSVDSGSPPRIGVQKPEQALPKRMRLRVEVSRSLYRWVVHSIRGK